MVKVSAQKIAETLFSRLWEAYLKRVPYAQVYSDMVDSKGGQVVHDHIAFRTINTHTGEQPGGIQAIQHILECFEYKAVENYVFPKKKLRATHFGNNKSTLPKIFVSQLEVEVLPEWAQKMIKDNVKETPYLLSDTCIELLNKLKKDGHFTAEAAEVLIRDLLNYFHRPWKIPKKETVLKLNDISQYAAWVMLHGNSVNHFAAFINEQGVSEWPDLEATCQGLVKAGIPMNDKIEGEKGSKLRQAATVAVKEEVEMRTNGGTEKLEWTYAYFELTQRNYIEENGKQKLFSGFLGNQARHLFDMTVTHDN